MSLLTVEHLSRSFGGVRAVDDVSFSLEAGEVAALIGPNGAGKSTLFKLLGGELAADRGRVSLHGAELKSMTPAVRNRLGIGRTFQVAQTFGSMSARENLQVAIAAADGAQLQLMRSLWSRDVQRADALLAQVGLGAQGDRPAASLAYSDAKRLELALALASGPTLLLMDEPTAGMAAGERAALMKLLLEEVSRRSMAVLFTEHSMDVVFGFAQRVMVLSRGRLIADGAPAEIRGDAEVQAVYLGEEA